MFKITTSINHSGFDISIGDRYPVHTETVESVCEAFRHWNCQEHDDKVCAFCRNNEEGE